MSKPDNSKGQRKADRVAQDLLSQIVGGELPVGSLLPKESDLAEQYGVNRSVVREANKLLEVHGLVQPIRRRGTEVLEPTQSLSPQVLRAMLVDQDGGIRTDVLAEFLEIRTHLDIMMVGLGAERRTDEDLARLDAQLQVLEEIRGDPLEYGKVMGDLSLLLAEASHNRIFVMLAHWHRRVYLDFEALFVTARTNTEAHLTGARMLVDAIRAGDRATAETIVRTFHEWANEQLMTVASSE